MSHPRPAIGCKSVDRGSIRGNRATNSAPKNRKSGPGKAALLSEFSVSGLGRLHVLGLPALGTLDYIELDLLALLEAAKSTRLDRREVNENVLAILAADETISFCVVKPLYCSCFHGVAYVPLSVMLRESLAGLRRQDHAVERRY